MTIQYTQSDVDRFWSYVDQSAGPDACWPWLRSFWNGYGQFYLSGQDNAVKAHRFAWVITNGQIPNGICVCHHCDNPSCCNSSHLWLGTKADNSRDMQNKGRGKSSPHQGIGNPASKLTEQQVLNIRTLHQTGLYLYRELAKLFNVTETSIRHVINRKTWKHI